MNKNRSHNVHGSQLYRRTRCHPVVGLRGLGGALLRVRVGCMSKHVGIEPSGFLNPVDFSLCASWCFFFFFNKDWC